MHIQQNLQSSRQNSRPSQQIDSVMFEPWKQAFPPQIIQVLLITHSMIKFFVLDGLLR
jgi:hypothetical protein